MRKTKSRTDTTATNASPTRNGEPPLTVAPEDYPDVSNLVTEDGKPVENIYVEKQYRLLNDPLYASWEGPAGKGRFIALTNVGLFSSPREPPLVPAFLLSDDIEQPADLTAKEHQSYFVWVFGKFPDVVGEIVSDRRGREDTLKLRQYARLRIPYYFIYDRKNLLRGGVLRVFGLALNGYEPIADNWLSTLSLGLTLWRGTYAGLETQWLRWCDRDGIPLLTDGERAEQERQRAEQERQRAEQERQRAEQERQRARTERYRTRKQAERIKRLEAQLRDLGSEPTG